MKQFSATWGAGYAHQCTKTITLEDITEENGWWEENIYQLENAKIGEIVDCSDLGGDLHVQRIA